MDTPLPDHRTGARWVAATGASLLAAAAVLFVAVRWSELSDTVRFGLLVACTAACLVAGRRIRGPLPATGDALFHLGAILLPIDLAALNLRLQLGWRGLLLAEGFLVTAVLGGLGLATGSAVLRRAGIAGGVALAAGLAAVGPLPGPLVLAILAVVALGARQEEAATVWAVTGGLAPLLSTLVELGSSGEARLASALSGVVAALVLGRLAARRRHVALAAAALLAAAIGPVDAWFRVDPGSTADHLALGSLFLLVQLAGLAVRRDPFWRRPAGVVVAAAEVVAGVVTLWVAGWVAVAPLLADLYSSPPSYPADALAAVLLAAGWVLAAGRRWPAVRPAPLLGAGVGLAVAMVLVTMRPLPAGAGLAVVAAGLLLAAERLPATRWPVTAGAAAFAVWGTVCATTSDELRVVFGAVVAWALAWFAARLDSRIVAVAATLSLGLGLVAEARIPRATGLALAVAGTWGLAVAADALGSRRAGNALRWSILLLLTHLRFHDAGESVAVLAAATIALAVEALRTDDVRFAHAGALLSTATLATVAAAAGLSPGEQGVVLCIGAVVPAGIAALVDDRRWQEPPLLAAAAGVALGLGLATDDGRSLATAVMVSGALVLGAAIVGRSVVVGHAGAAALSAGLVGHLWLAGIGASEAYLAPVALQLAAAGVVARRQGPISSWIAFTPPVVVLGGAGFAERVLGGSGWHALVAGGVGVGAVAAGAWRRFAGPLLSGTVLLVAVTGHESLGVAATVPTWAWLAVGGVALLGTGVALERNDTSPMEAGRRLVDLVHDRFD